MATLAEIRTRVLAKLVDQGGAIAAPSGSQVDAEINASIDFYEPKRFWFNDTTAVGTLTVNNPSVPLPSDFNSFNEPSGITIEINSVRYPLRKVTPLQFDSMYSGGVGQPYCYVYRNQAISLYFAPDQAYQYRLYYTKNYLPLAADNDQNDFTNFADRLIEYKALAECYINYRSDPEMSAVYEKKANDELTRLVSQTKDRMATGNLTVEAITGPYRGDYINY